MCDPDAKKNRTQWHRFGATSHVLQGVALAVMFSTPLMAEDLADQAALQLEQQGYTVIESHRTLLGRLRIVAESEQGTRELVIDRTSGAILRDYFEPNEAIANGTPRVAIPGAPPPSGAQPPTGRTRDAESSTTEPRPAPPSGDSPDRPPDGDRPDREDRGGGGRP
ncbi:hypothetical protein [Pontivivens insulae]|uniref:PepSY domain-containing protein n=1 Tax=Pontivivens insulae TaxID=1639689 RepID=A0A2R8ADQ7_9RHOB|nr:hypothetical protein [Pontivivens insulae]RED14121.1 hypothetical protein DFR53_1475 [Pontivivens insulae]SPF30195.1 hypothetical protein POI8812_02530 [Pontivivens insulae]